MPPLVPLGLLLLLAAPAAAAKKAADAPQTLKDVLAAARTPPRKAAVPAVVPHDDTREVRTWTAAEKAAAPAPTAPAAP
jgi:hypothetical protein